METDKVVLTFTLEDGNSDRIEMDKNALQLNLRERGIVEVDLTPLRECRKLKAIELDLNGINSIDLQPLSSCRELSVLSLPNRLKTIDLGPLRPCRKLTVLKNYETDLEEIDLSPLSSCRELRELDLSRNHLTEVDLTPLSSCFRLERLYLLGNRLRSLDLYPLSACSRLQELFIFENKIKEIDITPLYSCPNLKRLDADEDIKLQCVLSRFSRIILESGLRLDIALHEELRPRRNRDIYNAPLTNLNLRSTSGVIRGLSFQKREAWKALFVSLDILAKLDLKWLGLVENIAPAFENIPQDANLTQTIEAAKTNIIEAACKQIDSGGTTIGLDVSAIKEHGNLESRIPKIIERRQLEMEQAVVRVNRNKVDLRGLWVTAYGYEVLRALGERLTTDLKGLEFLKNIFAEGGFDLKTCRVSTSDVKTSSKLKDAVPCFAEKDRHAFPEAISEAGRELIWRLVQQEWTHLVGQRKQWIPTPPETRWAKLLGSTRRQEAK